ncbi:hypothetical protein RugamoR57_41100 [Duganella caerulea]|uniref:hypothetical protein n=1 Tax=Duganella caerulea TaxID=2885762 RepID=UPI0030EB0FEE
MTYTPLRIDFVDLDVVCTRTGGNGRHGFKTHTAYILLNEDTGDEQPFGPKCAEIVLGGKEALRGIPDFTTRDFTPDSGDGDQGTGKAGGGGSGSLGASADDKARGFATRYLLLRMDRVANIPGIVPGIRFEALQVIYDRFQQTRQLTDDDIRYIVNLEKSERTPAEYRSTRLLDVYTAYVQLQREIKRTTSAKGLEFLTSVRDNSLLRKLKLSRPQIETAKLKLHPEAFLT